MIISDWNVVNSMHGSFILVFSFKKLDLLKGMQTSFSKYL